MQKILTTVFFHGRLAEMPVAPTPKLKKKFVTLGVFIFRI
jgi:hypothetical protein